MSSPIASYDLQYRSKDGEDIVVKCIPTRPLQGRGQPSAAGFYRECSQAHKTHPKQYLVKADRPGICLAESTATDAFLVEEDHRGSINCAHIGFLNGQLVSVQAKVEAGAGETIIGFDEYVYGGKRDPSTWWSEESRHASEIQVALASLTPRAEKDLAHALFASTALGDESLHLGQFMAVTSGIGGDRKIQRIVRVDFGARERFTKKRFETFDFHPTKTSKYYERSGQFNKDYISYLLVNPLLKIQFLSLWETADVEKIVQTQLERFRSQLSIIPDKDKAEALNGFLVNFNKCAHLPVLLNVCDGLDNNMKHFFLAYEEIVRSRCTHMQKEAMQELRDMSAAERAKAASSCGVIDASGESYGIMLSTFRSGSLSLHINPAETPSTGSISSESMGSNASSPASSDDSSPDDSMIEDHVFPPIKTRRF